MCDNNPVGLLKELCEKYKCSEPTYKEIPTGERDFEFSVEALGCKSSGRARNQREAKSRAAQSLLDSWRKKFESQGSQEKAQEPKKEFVNWIGILMEHCIKKKLQQPLFNIFPHLTKPQKLEFEAKCSVGRNSVSRRNISKKSAKHAAAKAMLDYLGWNFNESSTPGLENRLPETSGSTQTFLNVDSGRFESARMLLTNAPAICDKERLVEAICRSLGIAHSSFGARTEDGEKVVFQMTGSFVYTHIDSPETISGRVLDFIKSVMNIEALETQKAHFVDGSNFFRNKSTSEPDLSDSSPPQSSRWHKKLPHEYITVDELGFHRRRKPPDTYSRSTITLYNTSEPCIPFSALKSEYRKRFPDPLQPPPPRSPLLRRPTSLKVSQHSMETESEQRGKFRLFLDEELTSCRRSAYKYPENLKLTGEVDYRPEYTTAYVPYSMLEVRKIEDRPLQEITNRQNFPMSNLPVESLSMYNPEYSSQFVEFSGIEKSHSIPQLNNIRLQGDFHGVAEYTDKFKSYESVARSTPIRKPDNLSIGGEIEVRPEYREQFREPERAALERCQLLRKDDHLKMSGEFSKRPPEYLESFKDHHITAPPHRAKARETFLNLNGATEFNPEYRCRFLDFPRSRPVTRKPDSHFRLSAMPDGTYIRRFTKNPAPGPNIHTPPDVPFEAIPEYRKAKTDYIIKERTPSRDRIPSAVQPRKDLNDNSERRRRPSITPTVPSSPTFRLMVENVDEPQPGRFRSPKFGRRAAGGGPETDENATRIRERVSVVEGNTKYSKKDANGNAFVVLKQQKQSEWMKPKWYEGAS